MCQFPGFARTGLYIQPAVSPSSCEVMKGFPIRKSPDQCSFDSSPELIAAYHVLHRLSTPRHSPCTLSKLIAWMTDCSPVTRSLQSTFGANIAPLCVPGLLPTHPPCDELVFRQPCTLKRFTSVRLLLPAYASARHEVNNLVAAGCVSTYSIVKDLA